LGLAVLSFLGAILIYNAFKLEGSSQQEEKIFFSILGSVILYLAFYFARKPKRGILFKADGLYELDGTLIRLLDEIKEVDVSPYSFKPANGFIIRLKERTDFGWAPGLWWKFNLRMTVGGMISKQESMYASQTITHLLENKNSPT
jgi:hypothetical protein